MEYGEPCKCENDCGLVWGKILYHSQIKLSHFSGQIPSHLRNVEPFKTAIEKKQNLLADYFCVDDGWINPEHFEFAKSAAEEFITKHGKSEAWVILND